MFRGGDRFVRRTAGRSLAALAALAVALIVAACSGSGMSTDGGPDAVGDGGAGAGGAIGTAGRGGAGGAAGEGGTGGGGTCTASPAGNAQCTSATLSHLYLCSGTLVPARCTFLYAGDTVAAYCCP